MPDDTLTNREVADWLGLSFRTIREWAIRGVLPYKLGGTQQGGPIQQFDPDDVAEFIMKHRTADTELTEILEREALLTKPQVAERLRVSSSAVARMRAAGTLEAIEFRHNLIRYHPEDVANMIAAHKQWSEHTEDHGETDDADIHAQIRAALGTRFKPGRQLLTSKETMKWLGLGDWSVRQLAEDGYLPLVTLPPLSVRRFDAYDVQELVERRRPQMRGEWAALPLGGSE